MKNRILSSKNGSGTSLNTYNHSKSSTIMATICGGLRCWVAIGGYRQRQLSDIDGMVGIDQQTRGRCL